MVMKYLIRDKGNKQKAHIWLEDEKDSACYMWSSGGMNKSKGYKHYDTNMGKDSLHYV